jgi:NTE family protein
MGLIPHRRRRFVGGGRFDDAIVLSGGGSLGAVQVGALRALLEAGMQPDLLVGCSVGALNAAFLAAEATVERLDELETLWRRLDRGVVFPSTRRSVAGHLVRRDAHLYEPDGLRALIRNWIPYRDLAETDVPCHVVTTDLLDGRPCWWSSGDPIEVLVASCSLPGLLPPVSLGGSVHVDGGVTCPVPSQRAAELGARRIWVLDVTGGSLGRRDERMSALDVLLLSFAISRQQLGNAVVAARADQHIVRMPMVSIGRHDLRDFSRTGELIRAGYLAGQRMLADARTRKVAVPPQRVPDQARMRIGVPSGST